MVGLHGAREARCDDATDRPAEPVTNRRPPGGPAGEGAAVSGIELSGIQPVADVRLASSSLVELAVDQLRREILGGAFMPGDRLVEEQITRRFQISRAPLREALRLLAQQGLVEHLPRRGVRVATLSPTDVHELFELRDLLERHAVGKAMPGAGDLTALRRELAAMREAAVTGRAFERAEAHRRFHVELVALAGQRQLRLAYEPIVVRLQLHMAMNLRREEEVVASADDGVRRHTVLLEAVESDDPTAVLATLATHGAQTYLTTT
jgi:DNA-binding GntR family transcriptional regulator